MPAVLLAPDPRFHRHHRTAERYRLVRSSVTGPEAAAVWLVAPSQDRRDRVLGYLTDGLEKAYQIAGIKMIRRGVGVLRLGTEPLPPTKINAAPAGQPAVLTFLGDSDVKICQM